MAKPSSDPKSKKKNRPKKGGRTRARELPFEPFFSSAGVEPRARWMQALEDIGIDPGGDIRTDNGEHACVCPAHADSNPSLSWRETSMGEILFHCHAGCEGTEVVKALQIKWWQLKHVNFEFDYFDQHGTYRYTVKRSQSANGGKQFQQFRKTEDGGTEPGNGLEPDEGLFWMEPALEEWAQDLRASGIRDGVLVLVEGEKDAVSVWTAGGLGTNLGEFCTTTSGGSKGWNIGHTQRMEQLLSYGILSQVVVVCDPDTAGARRGAELRELLADIDGGQDLAVKVVTIDPGLDLGEVVDEYKTRWDRKLVELDEAENRTLLEEGTAACGWMLRMPLGLGAANGRVGLGVRVVDEPKLAVGADIWPTSRFEDGTGWTVDVQPPRGDTRSLILMRSDLSSKGAFDKWMIEKARVSLTPRSGIGGGEVAQSLAAWLDWLCEVRDVGAVRTTAATDWVHPLTGEPMRKVGFDGVEPVWIDGEDDQTRFVVEREGDDGSRSVSPWLSTDRGDVGTDSVGLRYVGVPRTAVWGRELSSREAAQAWAQALLFGDRESVAGIAGWAASMVLMPWLGQWAETKPGLAVIANSGSGKTSGAGRLILGLCGAQTNATMTPAALRRSLSQGGVSSIWWLDDSSHVNDDSVKEIMRVATSQGEHVLGNADAGAGATSTTSLHGCLVVSAEGVSWMGETAMLDRFCFVHPANPQGRVALWGPEAGGSGGGKKGKKAKPELQWVHVQEWMRQFDNGNRVAGWTVRGLWSQRHKIESWIRGDAAAGIEGIGRPAGRQQVAEWLVAIGVRALAGWLADEVEQAESEGARDGRGWLTEGFGAVEGGPGTFAYLEAGEGAENPLEDWGWLIEAGDKRLEKARSEGKRLGSIVTEVLPLVYGQVNRTTTGTQVGAAGGLILEAARLRDLDDGQSEFSRDWTHDQARGTIMDRLTGSDGMEWSLPLVIEDGDGRLWVSGRLLAQWYTQNVSRLTGGSGDIRTTSESALKAQLKEIEDTPDWAFTEVNKGGGRKARLRGIQLQKKYGTGSGQGGRAQYVRLTEEASLAVIHSGLE